MTHTLNRRSRRPDGPQAADGAPRRPTRLSLALRAALALLAAPAVLAPGAAQAQAVQARAASYRIPAGPLAEALPRFADAAGVTVLFDAALLGARGTGGLNGSYSVSEGFARLLAGSGLAARERSAGIYVLVPQAGVTNLDPVRVEGEGSRPAPAWQSSTDRKRLDELQVRNWSDFGRRVEPGVNFNRLTNSINIRGLDQDRVLTRVDGIRLPWLDDGARGVKGGLESVDFNSLSRLDIVRGADASGSGGGSGAISGIADLRTLNPSDLLEDGKRFGALAKTDYDTTDSSWGANAALAGQIHENTFWLVQAGLRNGHAVDNRGDVGGYGPRRNQPTPRTTASAASCSLQQRVDGGHRFGVTGEYFKRTADFDNMFEQGAGTSYLYGENSVRKETERQRVSLDYSYRAPSDGGLLDTVTAALYWQRVSLDTRQTAVRSVDPRAFIIPRDPFRYGFPSGPYGRDNSIRQTMYGVNAEATKRLGGAVTQLWTLGGEWYGNKTEQQSSGYDNCPVIRPARPRHSARAPATCCTPTRPTCRNPRAASGPCGCRTNSASPTAATR